LAAHLKFETGRTFTMSRLEAYRDSFHNARLTRSNSGVLEVALHTDGGTLVFDGHVHEQFVDLFHTIGSDPDNRVVILTGTGGAFMESISAEGFDFFTPQGYDKIYREGKKVLMNILDVEVPLIAAANGPVRLHSEYVLLSDIVLATPSTVFQDKPHFEFGIVPGDGVHLLWQEVIGTVRGRYFILTRQESMPRRPRNGVPSTKLCLPTSCLPVPARLPKGSPSCRRSPQGTRASR
jgi:enoyl-CoA hydratase/carnithine racemase